MKLCTYCGSHMKMHNDHVQAKSKGGVTTVLACAKCNQSKGAKALMQWLKDIKKDNPYRWDRVVNYQKGKRSEFAIKVRTIRDK